MHDLRATIEQKFNSLVCNKGKLSVDSSKPIRIYGVVIGGRRKEELQHIEDQKELSGCML
jgi:hypothetical protein